MIFGDPTATQRGSALTATLGATAVLLPLAAFAVLLARGGLYIQNNTRAQAEAFYVADAGLTHALADIVPAVTFEPLFDGPDQQHGTSDDGRFPFREGVPGFFPHAPLRYEVSVEAVNATLMRLTSTGYGLRNASAVVEALAKRDPQPHVPAGLYAPTLGGLAVGHDFLISGFDHVTGDAPDHPTGTGTPLAAIAVADDASAVALQRGLASFELDRLVGKGGAGSIAATVGADLAALTNAWVRAPGAVALPVSALGPGAHLGTGAAPQVTVLDNDAVLSAPVDGVGILVAPAGLRIAGPFNFRGVVLIRGTGVFDNGSAVRVDGSLWMTGANAAATLGGAGAVTYNRELLAAIDQQLPGRLPHGVLLKGWREVF